MSESYTIYVHDDGETWTMEEPVGVQVTDEQLERIEGGEEVHSVVLDWDWPEYERKASLQWGVNDTQRVAIRNFIKRYCFSVQSANVMKGVLGLPSDWASVVMNFNGRQVTAGIAPDGRIHT
tara:strand:+ start:911 stop:1276 length:366 start_codon:yes stop_codon:yes gene_type:complete